MCTARVILLPRKDPVAFGLNEVKLFSLANNETTAIPTSKLAAVMSSQLHPTTNEYAAAHCIDGDTGPGPKGAAACQVTGDEKSPQLNVTFPCDTGKALDTIVKVEVYNRLDCCQNWLEDFELQLIDADNSTVAKAFPFGRKRDNYTFPGAHARARSGTLAFSLGWETSCPPALPLSLQPAN